MFKRFIILSVVLVIAAFAAPQSQEEAYNELKSAGMSESGLNGLADLDNKFKTEYPKVSGNEKAAEKFIGDFTAESQNFIKSMTPQDQDIYNNFVKRFEQD